LVRSICYTAPPNVVGHCSNRYIASHAHGSLPPPRCPSRVPLPHLNVATAASPECHCLTRAPPPSRLSATAALPALLPPPHPSTASCRLNHALERRTMLKDEHELRHSAIESLRKKQGSQGLRMGRGGSAHPCTTEALVCAFFKRFRRD
jgi:hypothetical protein